MKLWPYFKKIISWLKGRLRSKKGSGAAILLKSLVDIYSIVKSTLKNTHFYHGQPFFGWLYIHNAADQRYENTVWDPQMYVFQTSGFVETFNLIIPHRETMSGYTFTVTRRVHTKKELVQSSRLLRKPQVSIALEIMDRDSVSRKYIPVPQNQPQLLKHLDSLSNYEKDGASPTVWWDDTNRNLQKNLKFSEDSAK